MASGMSSSTAAPKLDAKTTPRDARSVLDWYIDRGPVATRYAPVPVVFIVVLPLTERRQYFTRNAKNTKGPPELCRDYNKLLALGTPGPGNPRVQI